MTTKATTLSCRHSAVSSGIRLPPPRQGHSPTVPVPALSPNSPRAHPRPHRLLRRPRHNAALSRTGPGRGAQEGTSQTGGDLHGGGGSGNSGARHYRRKEVGGDTYPHPFTHPHLLPARPAPSSDSAHTDAPACTPRPRAQAPPISCHYRPLRRGPAPVQHLRPGPAPSHIILRPVPRPRPLAPRPRLPSSGPTLPGAGR